MSCSAIKVFNVLVSIYPYHPILWRLYSVNHYLHAQKPIFGKKVKIWEYHNSENVLFAGDLGDIHDVIVFDDEAGSCGTTAILSVLDKITELDAEENVYHKYTCSSYDIPREWCKRIIGQRDNAGRVFLYLLPFEFCCRQILRKAECGIVQCRTICIEPEYYLDKTFFHVGCGGCFEDIHVVYNDVSIYTGLKRLDEHMKEYESDVATNMLYVLGQYQQNLPYHFLVAHETGVFIEVCMYSGEHLKKFLIHILVCRICVKYLRPFLNLLYRCIISYNLPNEKRGVRETLERHNGIPCIRYILDGNFDIINECAYNAVVKNLGPHEIKRADICKKCVDAFMFKHI